MFEKGFIPDARKENIEPKHQAVSAREAPHESPLVCTGLMLAALVMPALSGRADASMPVAAPNVEYVISNDDLPIIHLVTSEQPASVEYSSAEITNSSEQTKEETKSGGWVKPVLALASALAKAFSRSDESEEEDDN